MNSKHTDVMVNRRICVGSNTLRIMIIRYNEEIIGHKTGNTIGKNIPK